MYGTRGLEETSIAELDPFQAQILLEISISQYLGHLLESKHDRLLGPQAGEANFAMRICQIFTVMGVKARKADSELSKFSSLINRAIEDFGRGEDRPQNIGTVDIAASRQEYWDQSSFSH